MVQIIYYMELLKQDKMRKRMYETGLRTRSRKTRKRDLITAYEMDLKRNKFFDNFVRDNLEAIQTNYPKFFDKFARNNLNAIQTSYSTPKARCHNQGRPLLDYGSMALGYRDFE